MSFPAGARGALPRRPPAARGRRHARQDHVDVDAGLRARALRARSRLADRRRAARSAVERPARAAARGSSSRATSTTRRTSTRRPKFLHYRPTMLLLTAVEFDHADIYRDLDAVKGAFRQAARAAARRTRRWRSCGDFPHALDVVAGSAAAIERFGLGEQQHVARHRPASTTALTRFRIRAGRPRGVRGDAARARAASTRATRSACSCWRNRAGVPWTRRRRGAAATSAASAGGRRWSARRAASPSSTTSRIIRRPSPARWPRCGCAIPGRRLRAVFEPRSNTSRRKVFQAEFADGAAPAPTRSCWRACSPSRTTRSRRRSGCRPRPSSRTSSGAARAARTLDGVPAIRDYLLESARPGDVIVIMSNGAFGGLPRLVADGLGAAAAEA